VRELILFAVMFVVILGVIGLMVGWSKFLDWRESVKRSGAAVMSRASADPIADAPSSEDGRETDARRTPIVLPERKIRAEELLTLCTLMRRYDIPREAAAAAFKAVDLPFNNNVWSKAAPEEPPTLTPIAGRPTAAQFRDDELAYEPLR